MHATLHPIQGDSVVLIAQEPAWLASPVDVNCRVRVRSSYGNLDPGCVTFEEGRDYLLDRRIGSIRRTPNSRIPDWSKNVLYGQRDFDHTKYPGLGNGPFMTYVDYVPQEKLPVAPGVAAPLAGLKEKLQAADAGPLRLLVLGDSISNGCEATLPGRTYFEQYRTHLIQRYAKQVDLVNRSVGGETTRGCLARVEWIARETPADLVLLAYGMNDQNIYFENDAPGQFVSVCEFASNLRRILQDLKTHTSADLILVTPCEPNPLWCHTSGDLPKYRQALLEAAAEYQCAVADVTTTWQNILKRKKPEDLLMSNINHPNDFGHWLYAQSLIMVAGSLSPCLQGVTRVDVEEELARSPAAHP